MEGHTQALEKSMQFENNYYNWTSQLASNSNLIAANFGLTMQQQRMLLLSFIPSISPLFKELSMKKDLGSMFTFISMNSDSLSTRSKLEYQIEKWQLATTNQHDLIHSLLHLKDLFVRHTDVDLDRIDQRQLYLQLVARLHREKGMPAIISCRLDETRFRIERLDDAVEMNALLITAIKDIR